MSNYLPPPHQSTTTSRYVIVICLVCLLLNMHSALCQGSTSVHFIGSCWAVALHVHLCQLHSACLDSLYISCQNYCWADEYRCGLICNFSARSGHVFYQHILTKIFYGTAVLINCTSLLLFCLNFSVSRIDICVVPRSSDGKII